MFRTLSHEFRNPLNHINGALELAEQNVRNEEQVLHYLGMARNSQELLQLKTNDVLDFSQIEMQTFTAHKELFSVERML